MQLHVTSWNFSKVITLNNTEENQEEQSAQYHTVFVHAMRGLGGVAVRVLYEFSCFILVSAQL